MGIPNWLWPDDIDPVPGIGARLGRVIHWIAIAVAAPLALAAFTQLFRPDYGSSYAIILGGCAIVFALGGRGLRYILGGE